MSNLREAIRPKEGMRGQQGRAHRQPNPNPRPKPQNHNTNTARATLPATRRFGPRRTEMQRHQNCQTPKPQNFPEPEHQKGNWNWKRIALTACMAFMALIAFISHGHCHFIAFTKTGRWHIRIKHRSKHGQIHLNFSLSLLSWLSWTASHTVDHPSSRKWA